MKLTGENSETYHLKCDHLERAQALLQRAGVHGYVIPEGEYAAIVPEGEQFVLNHRLVKANTGILLRYYYSEENAFGFDLMEKDEVVSSYECCWSSGFSVYDADFSKEAMRRLLGEKDWEACLRVSSLEEVDERELQVEFARLVGLTCFEWLSYDEIQRDESMLYEIYPDMRKV